jgi:DNA-binding response OmpR family regulator
MRILLVEDEAMIAILVEDMAADFGGELVATADRLDDAVAQASEGDFDLAVLDLNLAGTFTFPVADILRPRGIPFVFATGYGTSGLDPGYEDEVTLQKPFVANELEKVIRKILA